MRTIGHRVVELALHAVVADAMYVVQQGIAGLEAPHRLYVGTDALGCEVTRLGHLGQSADFEVAKSVIHELRSPCLATLVALEGVGVQGLVGSSARLIHIFKLACVVRLQLRVVQCDGGACWSL